MWIVRERIRSAVHEAPRHPEVNQENTPALEPNNQILAAPVHALDDLARELGGDLERIERANESSVQDLDVVEAAARQGGLQPAPDRLDLGQLGHRRRR